MAARRLRGQIWKSVAWEETRWSRGRGLRGWGRREHESKDARCVGGHWATGAGEWCTPGASSPIEQRDRSAAPPPPASPRTQARPCPRPPVPCATGTRHHIVVSTLYRYIIVLKVDTSYSLPAHYQARENGFHQSAYPPIKHETFVFLENYLILSFISLVSYFLLIDNYRCFHDKISRIC